MLLRTLFILLTFGILKVLSLRRRAPGHVCLKLPEWCVETINTTCLTKMNPDAHYHRLVDCLVPEYLALKKAATSTACVIGCGSRCEYLRYLVVLNEEKNQTRFFKDSYEHCTDFHAITIHEPRTKDLDLQTRLQGAALLADDVSKSINFDSARLHVLVVSRKDSRSFEPESLKRLMKSITSIIRPIDGQLEIYHGDESLERTISLFHRADVVIMFHGAAAGNLVFSRSNVIFFELSTYTDVDSKKQWRSNTHTLTPIKPDIISIVYYLPLRTIVSNATLTELCGTENKDKFVKSLRNIRLVDSEIEAIATKLKTVLSVQWANLKWNDTTTFDS